MPSPETSGVVRKPRNRVVKKSQSKTRMLHVVIGTPDLDNCPICRAHKANSSSAVEGTDSPIRVEELQPAQVLRCPCPLCTEARQDVIED